MATLLADLVPDALSQILSYDCTLSASIDLWKCGSSALQSKLSASVTKVKLVNKREVTLLRLPSCLKDFRALQSLVVLRRNNIIYDPAHTFEVLKNLSPKLEKLVLKFRGSGFFFNPCAASERVNVGDSWDDWNPTTSGMGEDIYIDAGSSFPALKTLKLDENGALNSAAVQSLPRGLSNLTVSLTPSLEQVIASFQVLPPNLTKLSIPNRIESSPSIWSALPPTLRDVFVNGDKALSTDDWKNMPRELEKLKVSVWGSSTSLESIQALPPTLQSGPIGGLDIATYDLSMQALPKSLTDFSSIQNFPQKFLGPVHIRMLPRNLKSLACVIHLDGFEEGDFPMSLTSLHINSRENNVFPVSFARALPPFLQSLSFRKPTAMDLTTISILPQYLTSLTARIGEISADSLVLPPTLITLDLDCGTSPDTDFRHRHGGANFGDESEDATAENSAASAGFRYLPMAFFTALKRTPRLKTLNLTDGLVPMSALAYFPVHLEEFKACQFVKDRSFDLSDPKWEERARELVKEGLEVVTKEEKDSVRSDLPVHFFDLLPRRLHSIKVGSPEFHTFAPEDWARLPHQSLTSISLESAQPLDAQILRFIPMRIMQRIELQIEQLDDETIKLFGDRLHYFDTVGEVEWPCEPNSAKLCPIGLILGDGINDELWSELMELDEQRKNALLQAPSPDIYKLFTRSTSTQEDENEEEE